MAIVLEIALLIAVIFWAILKVVKFFRIKIKASSISTEIVTIFLIIYLLGVIIVVSILRGFWWKLFANQITFFASNSLQFQLLAFAFFKIYVDRIVVQRLDYSIFCGYVDYLEDAVIWVVSKQISRATSFEVRRHLLW